MNENIEIAEKISRLFLVGGYDIITIKNIISETLKDYSITKIDKSALSMQDYINHFINSKLIEGVSPKTADNYKIYLEMFASKIQKEIKIIDTNDVRLFIFYLSSERNLKQTSIQSIVNILRSFFGWLTTESIISKNPMDRIRSFKIDKQNTRTPLTIEELELLRNACKNYKEKSLVEFLYSTGCRISEATQIDIDKINFEQKTVSVIGKGNKIRTLHFNTRTKLMIQEYLKERNGGLALFCSSKKPYQRLGERSVQKILQSIGETAGITKQVHPHILRHTFATNALNQGMDIATIQNLLGHSNVNTTQIYAKVSQNVVQHNYDKFML